MANSFGNTGGGSYGFEVSLSLLFWNEMRRYDNSMNPPVFDGGIVKEFVTKTTCKVKLIGAGVEVIASCGFSTNIVTGMYALVLCSFSKISKSTKYSIVAAKRFSALNNPVEVPIEG